MKMIMMGSYLKRSESFCIECSQCNISTQRMIVEFRWDPEKYTNGSFLAKRQRGEGPRISILMDMDNL